MGSKTGTRALTALTLLLGGSAIVDTASAQPAEIGGQVESASELASPPDGFRPEPVPRFSADAVAAAEAERERPPDRPSRLANAPGRRVGGPLAMTLVGFGVTLVAGLGFGLAEGLRCFDPFGTDPCGSRSNSIGPLVVGTLMALGLVLGIVGVVRLRNGRRDGRSGAHLDARGLHF